jgi:hypothetical protein
LGLAVLVVIVSAWPALVYGRHPQAAREWITENLGRFEGELGRESVFFYAYLIPLLVMPWTPFVARGTWRAFVGDGGKMPLAVLATWFAIGVAVLSASAGKHDRYAAPVLPPLSVLAAVGLVDLRSRFPRRALAVLLAVIWLVAVSIEELTVPRMSDRYRAQAECARNVDRRMAAGHDLYLLDIPNNRRIQLAYYLTMQVHVVGSFEEMPAASEVAVLAPTPSIAILAATRHVDRLESCDVAASESWTLARIGPRAS